MRVLSGAWRTSYRVVLASALAAVLICAALVMATGIAAGANSLPLLGSFGSEGGGSGQLQLPRGLAVDLSNDPSRGDVYVADRNNWRVDKFGPVGNFVLAFGKDVNATKVKEAEEGKPVSEAEENVCTASSGDVCRPGEEGAANGEFAGVFGVAVDASSGDVYVEDRPNHRVVKYTSSGEFLLMFGGEVNATTGGDVCTATETCQAGVTASPSEAGEGKFHEWGAGALVAVGSSGTVFVGDENRVQEFDSNGSYIGQIELAGAGQLTALALDSSGNVYVKAEPSGVSEYDSSGALLQTFDPGSSSIGGVAVDSTGNVSLLDHEAGYRVLQYDASGNLLAESAPGSSEKPTIEASTGIAVNQSGTVYVSNFEPEFNQTGTAKVLMFGSPPSEGNPPPAIDAEFASQVGTNNAVLNAEINPEFLATTYHVQYGTSTSYAGGEVPLPPGAALGTENLGDDPARVALEGLIPGTTYHYRFVALSPAGETLGPDRTLVTAELGSFTLPDDRGFELVSPPQKNNAEVGVPSAAGGGDVAQSARPVQASPGGESITYTSFTAFGSTQSAPAASQYLSTRTATGWSTQNLSPLDQEGNLRDPLRGFSPDLSTGVVIQSEPVLAEGAAAGFENLYLRDDTSGSMRAVTTATPRVSHGERYCVAYGGAAADFGHVIFMANGALTANAPEAPGNSLYEWSPAGGMRLVSLLPGETAAQPSGFTGFGAGGGLNCQMRGESIVHHAISEDGSRIFWTYEPSGGASELLVRENGTTTVQIDAPQGVSGNGGEGRFWAASADGSKVFFTDRERLTADAPPGSETSLYEYDLNTRRLTDLTPVPEGSVAEVHGVLGASEDGSYVYFVAGGTLSKGAILGQDNLYVWHAGEGTRFVATLSKASTSLRPQGDAVDWSQQPKEQTARVTPDGLQLAFESAAILTHYDNIDQTTHEPDSEVYLYDAASGSLVCASCNPSGARPVGPSSVPAWSIPYEQPRYLSDDGGRLFFESFDSLALHDTNGRQDVWEYEREGLGSCTRASSGFSERSGGCLLPLSTGASSDNSYFLDASANGKDVFFATRQRLVPEDQDELFDVYDAREGGGFAPPPQQPPACADEACRAPSGAGPMFGAPASITVSGDGNIAPAPPASSSAMTPGTARTRPLTRAQKLARALRACRKKPKKKRAACARQAKKRYRSRSTTGNSAKRGE